MLSIIGATNQGLSTENREPLTLFRGFLSMCLILILLTPGLSWSRKDQGIQLKGATLSACKAERKACVEVTSEQFAGAQFKDLFYFSKATIKIQRGEKIEVVESGEGYWDVTGEYLMFSTRNAEHTLDMKSFSQSSFLTKGGIK